MAAMQPVEDADDDEQPAVRRRRAHRRRRPRPSARGPPGSARRAVAERATGAGGSTSTLSGASRPSRIVATATGRPCVDGDDPLGRRLRPAARRRPDELATCDRGDLAAVRVTRGKRIQAGVDRQEQRREAGRAVGRGGPDRVEGVRALEAEAARRAVRSARRGRPRRRSPHRRRGRSPGRTSRPSSRPRRSAIGRSGSLVPVDELERSIVTSRGRAPGVSPARASA